VRKSHFLTAVVAGGLLVIGVVISSVFAQTRTAGAPTGHQVARPAPVGVALIDISKVFKENVRFTSAMNVMKADVERAEQEMQRGAESVKSWIEEMRKFKPGSAEYKDWERRITEERSKLNVQAQLTRKEFLQKEAKIYHQVYQEIQYEVGALVGRYNVSVVLRFNSDKVDADNPEEVLRFINKPVVWHSPSIDITNDVIASLNRRAGGGVPKTTNQGVPPYNPARR
jgi:Skp family chaperone for outer membrane proteins